MDVWDLNAPAPLRREIHIPYEEALDKIKEVGKVLDERIPETFEIVRRKKAGLRLVSCRANKTAHSSKAFCRSSRRRSIFRRISDHSPP